jgi:adenosylmethionine-8-amino-7-oxononanoate aminotransferase
MSVSEASVFTRAFTPLLFEVDRAHAPYCYRCPIGLERATCGIACLGDLEAKLRARDGEVAAVIVEPMLQGAGGMIMWPAEFLAGVRRLCDRFGVLMIADEVLTGFGRTGRMFACEHAGVSPDIICLSKALTAGYLPMAVTATTEAVFDAFLSDDHSRTFFHGHSFTANPLACAVGLASLDLFADGALLGRIGRLEAQLRRGLSSLADLPVVGDVRVIGGVGAVELVSDKTSKSAGGYLDGIGPRLSAAFLARGILLRPLGNVLYFMPPYVITDDDVDWVIGEMKTVLGQIQDA